MCLYNVAACVSPRGTGNDDRVGDDTTDNEDQGTQVLDEDHSPTRVFVRENRIYIWPRDSLDRQGAGTENRASNLNSTCVLYKSDKSRE